MNNRNIVRSFYLLNISLNILHFKKMKNTIYLFCTVTLLFFSKIQSQEFNSPLDYMEYITNLQRPIMKKSWGYIQAFAHNTPSKEVDKAHIDLIKSLDVGLAKIEAMPAYNQDADFRDIGITYFKNMRDVFKTEYDEMKDLKDDMLLIYEALEEYMELRDTANSKMDAFLSKFQVAQSKFANKHKIILTNDNSDLAKKIKKSAEVIAYRDQLHLLFFRSYTLDNDISDALQSENILQIETANKKLIHSIATGLSKLTNQTAYENDDTLKKTVSIILKKYDQEATIHIPEIIKYYQIISDFKDAENKINTTPEDKRTEKMIDDYNNGVDKVNKAGKKYSKAINQVNEIKAEVILKWNTEWPKFLDRHIPK